MNKCRQEHIRACACNCRSAMVHTVTLMDVLGVFEDIRSSKNTWNWVMCTRGQELEHVSLAVWMCTDVRASNSGHKPW